MTAGTLEAPQVGKIETPDDTTETTHREEERYCHLVYSKDHIEGLQPVLCGKKTMWWLNMARPVDRDIYAQLGDSDHCTCHYLRCQECITIYEAFKHLNEKGDKKP